MYCSICTRLCRLPYATEGIHSLCCREHWEQYQNQLAKERFYASVSGQSPVREEDADTRPASVGVHAPVPEGHTS